MIGKFKVGTLVKYRFPYFVKELQYGIIMDVSVDEGDSNNLIAKIYRFNKKIIYNNRIVINATNLCRPFADIHITDIEIVI